MPIIKCKMCGGDLNIVEDSTVCECEYCGTKQTVPKVDDEKKLKLFERANRLRSACEFDKAAGVYETIIADFNQEAEAYWGLILCKYGIEYVDDPATGKKVPTCHRSSFDSLMDDANFDMVMECADPIARRVYRDEAKVIEELRKNIIEVSSKEEPYDVFISYKELDENGERTLDSVIAQDIYTELTDKGYRVFFSRISLESKLGVEYEPYIFAALNSSKVMLVVGTDYDYFNAVWVKNEWSRFLALIASGQKKTLIPVFKGIDAYDMPKEFNKLAAQDMGKVGAMQDLVRGVEKIVGKKQMESAPVQRIVQQVVQGGGANVDALLKRGFMSLEDSQWDKAKELFDKVLNETPENAEAYLGLAMAEAKATGQEAFKNFYIQPNSTIRRAHNIARARQFNPEFEMMFAEMDKQGELRDTEYRLAEEQKQIEEAKRKEAERSSREEAILERRRIAKRVNPSRMISAGDYHSIGLMADGTVMATPYISNPSDKQSFDGGQSNLQSWNGIIAVAAGGFHSVGLKEDGTVVAKGGNGVRQCEVSAWHSIVAIAAGNDNTVGLVDDGTVVSTVPPANLFKGHCMLQSWSDIIAIDAKGQHTVGLKSDGTVVAAGGNSYGQCNVSDWKGIIAIASGDCITAGLKEDGTVVTTAKDGIISRFSRQIDFRAVSAWTKITAISAGDEYVLGLKEDGTVVAAGHNACGACEVSGWSDIVAVSAGEHHAIGLRSDGTVVSTSYVGQSMFCHGQCETQTWKLFKSLETFEAERKAAIAEKKAKQDAALKDKISSLTSEKASLQNELDNIKGLFAGIKKTKIETRLSEIEAEITKLNYFHSDK